MVVEPWYEGAAPVLTAALAHLPAPFISIGVPRRFIHAYGTRAEIDADSGSTRRGYQHGWRAESRVQEHRHAVVGSTGTMEIGLFTFAELYPDPDTGHAVRAEQRMRHLMAEVELADELGLDVFGIGEHHRPDLIVSAPAVVIGRRRRLAPSVSGSRAP